MAPPSRFPARLSNFLARHAVAASVVLAASVTFSVLLYFVLLLWAVITNEELGGPLALPGMMLVAFVGSSAAVIAVLFPVTAITQMMCAKVGKFRWVAEIAVSATLLITVVFAMTFAIHRSRTGATGSTVVIGTAACAVLLILLGLYWWSTQMTGIMIRVAVGTWRGIKRAYGKGRAA